MASITNEGVPLLPLFESAFATTTTFARAKLLGLAAILTTGRRTVANLLRTVAGLTRGDPSSYHRGLSPAQWSGLKLAALLTPSSAKSNGRVSWPWEPAWRALLADRLS